MKLPLGPSHCAVLADLAAGLVPILVKCFAHEAADAPIEGPRIRLIAWDPLHSWWRGHLRYILDDALSGEIKGVENFAVQRPASIIDPASQISTDLLSAQVMAADFTGD